MLQDIAPHHFDNSYQQRTLQENDYVLFIKHQQIAVKEDNDICDYPRYRDIEPQPLTYLFMIDKTGYYLASSDELPDGCVYKAFSWTMTFSDQSQMFAGITAIQLSRWYRSHRFCGSCGGLMQHDEKERKLICPSCHTEVYPTISPAVIIGVRHHDQLLMSRYAHINTVYYALLAGFAEIGETIEETVKREVFEEVGLHVKNITYYKSQPWSFTDTLLFGFYCDLDGDATITLDTDELSTAVWMDRDQISLRPHDISLTGEMMRRFKEEKDHEDPVCD